MTERHGNIVTRLATDDEGPVLHDLAKRCGFLGGELEWRTVFPFWWVAECEGQILGAIQFLLSHPIARMEHLAIDPDLSDRTRGVIVLLLTEQCCTVARQAGAAAIASMIPEYLEAYLQQAANRGYEPCDKGVEVVKRL